jgi:hypothetical protein
MSMSYDIYTGLLKAFPLPTADEKGIHFSYDNNHPKFNILKSSYPIESIAGDGEDFSKAVNLLHWVSNHIYHKGNYDGTIAHNSLDLLNYAYDKGNLCGINCVALATILSECLLAIGLKARRVFLMPCSPYDGDNHVVTHVYIREMNKWVMLDPTYNAFFSNGQGEYLSLLDLRNYLSNQEPVFINNEAKYNDDIWTSENTKENIEYFAKNLFYFQTSEKSTFGDGNAIGEGSAPENRNIIISPQGYDLKQIRLINIEYRIKKYGDYARAKSWIERVKQEVYNYCSAIEFEKSPFAEA